MTQQSSSSSCMRMIKAQKNSSGDTTVSVTLTDIDVVTCPICLHYLTIPVYQCENGHALCAPCCTKLANKCPYCSLKSGRIRCRPMEKVLESLIVPCRNRKYGCYKEITCSVLRTHEKNSCISAPCSCPVRRCRFIGSSSELKEHCRTSHRDSGLVNLISYDRMNSITLLRFNDSIVLQERNEDSVFVLRNRREPNGNAIYITRVGPRCCKTGLSYDLIARGESGSISLQSPTEIVQGMVPEPLPNKFVMVPKSAFGDSNQIKLKFCIWKGKRIDSRR